jgi:uncharacterized membrane protein
MEVGIMHSNLAGAFSRGFWNGFCSPMYLFDAILGRRSRDRQIDPARPSTLKRAPRSWIENLPSPQALEELERVVQGGADRIMRMAEQEQLYRVERRRLRAEFSIKQAERGRWMGFALVIVSVAAGVTTAFMQCPWQVPVAFVSVPLLGVVRAFVPLRRAAVRIERAMTRD